MINLARLIVKYSTAVQPGDQVMIWGSPLEPISTPLVREIYKQVLRAGGHPSTQGNLEGLDFIRYMVANHEQLDYVDPFLKLVYEAGEFWIQYLAHQ